jgi:hypothetical protein
MQTTSTIIEGAEGTVGPALTTEVADHLALARDITDATGDLIKQIEQAPGEPRAIHACAFLLARLVTDLQAVVHLVRMGYVAPALSLTAGMLEMAHTSMYIGVDEKRADKWLTHDDTKNAAPWGIYDIIQGVAKSINVPEATIRREWEVIYRTTCMAKHGNPLALKQVGFVERGDQRFILAGPHLNWDVRAWAHMSLGYAIRYTKLASLRFVADHVPPSPERDAMYDRWKALGDRQQTLASADVRTFGSKSMPDSAVNPSTTS